MCFAFQSQNKGDKNGLLHHQKSYELCKLFPKALLCWEEINNCLYISVWVYKLSICFCVQRCKTSIYKTMLLQTRYVLVLSIATMAAVYQIRTYVCFISFLLLCPILRTICPKQLI